VTRVGAPIVRLRLLLLVLSALVFVPVACGSTQRRAAHPSPPPEVLSEPERTALWSEAQRVFEARCVVCHGCYDAPCQLKLGTFDGVARGATSDRVYDSARLIAAAPTRLDVDAHDAAAWRKKGFHPVLPVGATSDPRASLLLRMLDLKRSHPLSEADDVAKADEIPTRRPFEDPKVARVYYRFVRRSERPLEKTMMPYTLSRPRLAHWRELFLSPRYDVDRLPGYEPEVAANPFRAFQAIPVARVLPHGLDLDRVVAPAIRTPMERLDNVSGTAASLVPEMSFLTVTSKDDTRTSFTILRDSAHTNVAHLFHEDQRRLPAEDELTVVNGFLGAYPNALFELPDEELPAFVDAIAALDGKDAYAALRRQYGVLRTSERFWPYSDRLILDHEKDDGSTAGLFDYNRLEGL